MTIIIEIILNGILYLQSEKDSIPISVDYVTKTGASGSKLRR